MQQQQYHPLQQAARQKDAVKDAIVKDIVVKDIVVKDTAKCKKGWFCGTFSKVLFGTTFLKGS
jgi:hypothetical protein